MLISEVLINRTQNVRFGETEPYEPFTDDKGKLFRSLQCEYGRCTSRMYVDRKSGKPCPVGWVFEKRMQYEDARDNSPDSYYVREVWVNLHDDHAQHCRVCRTAQRCLGTTGEPLLPSERYCQKIETRMGEHAPSALPENQP